MKNADYWRGRALILEEAAQREGAEYFETLEREFEQASKRVQEDLAVWYQRFADNNQISLSDAKKWLTSAQLEEFRWTVQDYIKAGESLDPKFLKQLENASAKVHISRLEAIQLQIQQQIEALYGNQLDGLDGVLRNIYRNGYYHTAFEIQRGINLGWDLQTLNDKQLSVVLARPWTTDGMTFRDRCWKNKADLVSTVQTNLIQSIIRGDGPDRATKLIADRFRVSKSKAARLVMTESAYFSAQSQKDCFNELDVEQFEIVETLDSHTCEICKDLDGKVFPMSDYEPGVTVPPFHPWCRGCTAPYFPDNFGERAARDQDGQVYYVPSEVTYRDWENTFLVDPAISDQLYGLIGQRRGLTGRTWENIWKDPVSVTDYAKKKSSIPSKREYFQQKLSYTTGTDHDKFEKLLNDLNDFEQVGKQYSDLTRQIGDLQDKLTELRTGVKIKVNPYTQARKDAAHWFTDKKTADDVLREPTGEIWKAWSEGQKRAAYEYTSGSGKFNRPLRGYQGGWGTYKGPGNVPLDYEGGEKYIRELTEALTDSTYDFDIWLQRGVETHQGVAHFLGIPESALSGSVEDVAKEVVGKVVQDEAFFSTSAVKGGGFSGTIFNVYAPKGTEMVYAEPFSHFGHGGLDWDGISTVDYFGSEFEVILQRGTKFRVLKAEKTNGQWYFDIEVVLPER